MPTSEMEFIEPILVEESIKHKHQLHNHVEFFHSYTKHIYKSILTLVLHKYLNGKFYFLNRNIIHVYVMTNKKLSISDP